MLKLAGFLIGMFVLCVLGVTQVACVRQEWQVERQTGSWLNRAQVAASASDMHMYLEKTRIGLEGYHMTEGHAALVWKTPENDMARIFEAVKQLEDRAGQQARLLANDPAYSQTTTYQVALDDLRGAIRELQLQQLGFYWRHDGLLQIILTWCAWLVLGLMTVVFVLAPWSEDDGY